MITNSPKINKITFKSKEAFNLVQNIFNIEKYSVEKSINGLFEIHDFIQCNENYSFELHFNTITKLANLIKNTLQNIKKELQKKSVEYLCYKQEAVKQLEQFLLLIDEIKTHSK